jgi:hypothetical protein
VADAGHGVHDVVEEVGREVGVAVEVDRGPQILRQLLVFDDRVELGDPDSSDLESILWIISKFFKL